MTALPTSALLKYLQTYNLLPHISPSPLSAKRPQPPHIALLQSTTTNAAAASNHSKAPWDEMNGQTSTIKTSIKNTFSNGVMTSTSTALYSTTSTLGLTGAVAEQPLIEDNIAMCDVEEARNTLAHLAQNHWNSISSAFVSTNAHGYGANMGRMNERDVIDDFVVALRAKGRYIYSIA
jgi:hypothetical protein